MDGSTGAYVFISYSREELDSRYVAALTKVLPEQRVPVWFDDELVSGDRWERELRARVDGCAALIVVMSPNSEASSWVQLEVGRARYQGRPVRSILLSGEPFQGLKDIHFEDARSGTVALSAKFVERLRADIASAAPGPTRSAVLLGHGFPPTNPHFVGRESLLRRLETSLYWGRSVAVGALQGTGGVGKTQLVTEYAHRHQADYDLVAWINAERVELIPGQLAALAPALGAPVTGDVLETARAVVSALGSTSLAWLMVFDNAGQPGDLLEWLPDSGAGHVIVTSRQTGFDTLGSRLDIDVLTSAEAIALLRTRISTVDDKAAGEIVESLGRLPLAVEQAAAYLAETGTPPDEYLRLLRVQGEDLLDQGYAEGYEHTVATVWRVSQASLEIASPAAVHLLRLCAFLGPEPVPLDLFVSNPGLLPAPLAEPAQDPLRFNATVGALIARSLARRSPDGVTIHRLLATVIRRALPEGDQHGAIATVRDLLHQRVPKTINAAPESWPAWRALLPHVVAATGHQSPDLGGRDRTARLLNLAGTYLHEQGQAAAAQPLLERALHLDETNRGRDHPNTLTSRNNLAAAYRWAGQVNRAIPLYEATLTDRLRVLGPDHTDTLISRNNLALAYQAAGQLNSAIPLYEAVLADRLRILGPDHPDTLVSRNNLAAAYLAVERVDTAIPLLEANLGDRLRILGPDHPQTLISRNNLAHAYRSAGRLDEAIGLHEAILADRLRILGPDHPQTLTSRNNLAHAHQAAGQLDTAIRLHEDILADMARVLGADHPNTLTSRNNLAGAYQAAGQLDLAITLYEATLNDMVRILGPDHPSTRAVRNNLGTARGQR